jgi:phosphoglycerol transferase MdoB-like AlkP superfamily enzyme
MSETRGLKGVLRQAWSNWKRFALWLGTWNTRLLLTLTYFLLIGPLSLILFVLRKDFLEKRRRKLESYWKELEQAEYTLERSRFQA